MAGMEVNDLLAIMVERNASDLHIKVGSPPTIRVNGSLYPIDNMPALTDNDTAIIVHAVTTEDQRKRFVKEVELDTGYTVKGLARFRVNIFQQQRSYGLVFRLIPLNIMTFDELKLPINVVQNLSNLHRGLVIITGPTGSGKSTTIASMIEYINNTARRHIMTIEDPIEYIFHDNTSLINQRELGVDTMSFATALDRVLRQDPDVIFVGEMRDMETLSATLTAAETGHLVLATMHTSGASLAMDRIIDSFPSHQQAQVRMQLSLVIEGVIYQALVPKADGTGRIVACEILVGTPAIRNLIREGKTHQMNTLIHTGGQFNMQTMDQALKDLYQKGHIRYEDAFSVSPDPENFKKLIGR